MNKKMIDLLEFEREFVRTWIKQWALFLDEPEHEYVGHILERHLCALATLNDFLHQSEITKAMMRETAD